MLVTPKRYGHTVMEYVKPVKQKPGQISLADAVALYTAFNKEHGIPAFIVGSMRRLRPYVGDVDLLTHDPANLERIQLYTGLELLADGPAKVSFIYHGFQIDLNLCDDAAEWGAALLHHTGSKQFNIVCRQRAIDRGLKLNQHGLFRDGTRLPESVSEEGILNILGLGHHIDPTNRMN